MPLWQYIWKTLVHAVALFFAKQSFRSSAALAFYTLFSMAPLLILLFAVTLGWLPAGGWGGGAWKHMLLPVAALALPEWVLPLFGLCLGWPSEQAKGQAVKPRMPVELILHQDRYRDPDPAEIGAYDATMAAYYRSRGSNARLDDWSAAIANAVQGKKRKHMLDFLRGRGFFRC
jgi:nitroreductase